MKKDTIAIIGLGKVGTAVGYLLRLSGYEISAVADRSADALKDGIGYTGGKACADPIQASLPADSIFITTTDDFIEPVCNEISEGGGFGPGKRVVHMSGAGGLDLLESARRSGAQVASIHPLQSFVDVKGVIENIPGSTFGITAEGEMKDWAIRVVRDLGGTPFFVSEEDKPLYHAAACMASNYLVTLMNMVEGVYRHLGMDTDEAIRAFWPLVRGTMKNMEDRGIEKSLTGPIARGDIGTIRGHLETLKNKMPELLDMYRKMGLFAVDIGLKNNTLSEDRADEIKSLLKGISNE
ncbi:MAG: DUF2520 domain-containing protein [Deltaproteobacteria bacterium]|nr:DUF2520 domain-containing protein [Deltaproteobacteria bacterium]MBW2596640.1 DUF2520 domain-containing protein [Deltaproteobacteria bacterium]MBW2650987.1 DUF2520 domain-containing protein [Deltaproteobacteria bacterium]